MPDNLTPAQRSYCMSKIRVKNTKPELLVQAALHKCGLRFKKHVNNIPGNPDIVFPPIKLAVFIDGDFWHGYRFSEWAKNLKPFWRKKISGNRLRDQRNFRKLRRMGWQVLRIWDHQIKRDLSIVIEKIVEKHKRRPNILNPLKNKQAPDQLQKAMKNQSKNIYFQKN